PEVWPGGEAGLAGGPQSRPRSPGLASVHAFAAGPPGSQTEFGNHLRETLFRAWVLTGNRVSGSRFPNRVWEPGDGGEAGLASVHAFAELIQRFALDLADA